MSEPKFMGHGYYMGMEEAYSARINELMRQLSTAQEKLALAKEALEQVTKNLGVPQSGYPAPVAYAYEIAKSALLALANGEGK